MTTLTRLAAHGREEGIETIPCRDEDSQSKAPKKIRNLISSKFYRQKPTAVLIGGAVAAAVLLIITVVIILLCMTLARRKLVNAQNVREVKVLSLTGSESSFPNETLQRITTTKPAVNPSSRKVDKAMKQLLLDHHNFHRYRIANGLVSTQPSAANMNLLDWDERPQRIVSDWLATCQNKHSYRSSRTFGPYTHVEQSLAAYSWGNANYLEAVWSWYEEQEDYTFAKISCKPSKQCVHYEIMTFAELFVVGCGWADCTGRHDYHTQSGCDYASTGLFNWVKIYQSGPPCSACPLNYPKCHEGLCATVEQCTKGHLTCTDSTTTNRTLTRDSNENPDNIIARVVKGLTRPHDGRPG
jgi:hypothetical protein